MGFLTDRTLATGVTLQDLIHIVITGDTSQGNFAGSSYKATIQQVSDAIMSGITGSTDYYVTGGTYSGGTLVLDRQNGSVTITGFTTGSTQLYEVGTGTDSTQRIGVSADASGDYSLVGGGTGNTSSGNYSFIGGGKCNTSKADYSTVSGGQNNTSSGDHSFIGGGFRNTSGNQYSTTSGGYCNLSDNLGSTVSGGRQNTSIGGFSTISGGWCNTSICDYSTVSGGYLNKSIGNGSFIGGGRRNTSSCIYSTVIGGSGNTASNLYSFVGGGQCNTASGIHSVVGGGEQNKATSFCNFVGGGGQNTALGFRTTIAGGRSNTTSSTYSIIGGGWGNKAICATSVIGGGRFNAACGDISSILGGINNTSISNYGTILGGSGNTVNHEMSATYGKDVISVSACTFHVNYLALQNTPETDVQTTTQFLTRDSVTGVLKTKPFSAITFTGDYLPLSGGTVTGGTIFTSGLTANTLNVNGLTQTSGITSTGGITFKQVTINSTYSATTQDYMIDVTGGTFTVYLPSAVGIQGRLLVVKNNGGGAVTVQPTLGQYIDGKPFVILGETNTIQLASNGSEWVAISYNISTVNSSTGVFAFTGLTIASPTTFTVAPVKGWIVDDTSNPLSPQLYYVDYSGGTHTATYVTATTATWIYLTSGGTISQSNIPITDQQRRQNIAIGKLGHANKTNIINAFSQPDFVLSPLAQLRDMFEPINLINGGVKTSTNGANLSFNTSAGYLHGLGINFANDTLNPNSLYVTGTAPCTFQYRTQTGGTASNTTFIDPTKKDVGGVVTTLSGTKATNQRIYLVQNGVFRVQYGQVEYSNLTQAIAGIATEQFVEFTNFTTNGILIGVLSVLSTATDLTDTTKAQFFNVSKFGDSTGAAGGSPTTNLQQAYNNSITPEITTNSTLGALSVKNGAGTVDNVTNVFEGVNAAGTTTSIIRADGAISGTSISATTFNLAGSQIESAWTSYAVSWTSQSSPQPVIGNGTITGYYKVIGKTAFVRVKLNWGTTTSGGNGDWRFSLPVNAASADGVQLPCSILDNGVNWYTGIVNGTYTGAVDRSSIITTASPSGALTANIPFTWGNLDSLQFNGSYEIA